MPTFTELERAAADVIAILKTIPEYAEESIVIFGGLALWRYLPRYRTTEDVDFCVTINNAPQSVKRKLLASSRSAFVQQADYFCYRLPDGSLVQIDFTADWQSPYEAAGTSILKNLAPGELPYISPKDLIIFKINSCGLRASQLKRRNDALDAQNLLESISAQGPVTLSDAQRNLVMQGLDDVVKYGTNDGAWWRQQLGL